MTAVAAKKSCFCFTHEVKVEAIQLKIERFEFDCVTTNHYIEKKEKCFITIIDVGIFSAWIRSLSAEFQ